MTRERIVIGSKEHLPGLRNLFLRSQGLIIGSGASHGEYGMCSKEGGVFTNGFLKALRSECRRSSISWQEIFPVIAEDCLKLDPRHPQHPILLNMP